MFLNMRSYDCGLGRSPNHAWRVKLSVSNRASVYVPKCQSNVAPGKGQRDQVLVSNTPGCTKRAHVPSSPCPGPLSCGPGEARCKGPALILCWQANIQTDANRCGIAQIGPPDLGALWMRPAGHQPGL